MAQKNVTLVREFVLLGFSSEPQPLLFGVFLIIYICTFLGNMAIILIVNVDPMLQSPMYLFLRSLLSTEILYISVTVPRLLRDLLQKNKTIPLMGCAAQFYFFCFFGATECFTLACMAYDRYVAICQPLYYINIMSKTKCVCMSFASWMLGLILPLGNIVDVFRLPFCRSNIIDHFFCDIIHIMPLACASTRINELYIVVHTFVVIPVPFMFIFVSYMHILAAVFRINSANGRRRTFSTCGSHLVSVSLFFGSASIAYLRTKAIDASGGAKGLSLMFLLLVPMLNPFIYSFRNTEMKKSIKRLLARLITK